MNCSRHGGVIGASCPLCAQLAAKHTAGGAVAPVEQRIHDADWMPVPTGARRRRHVDVDRYDEDVNVYAEVPRVSEMDRAWGGPS